MRLADIKIGAEYVYDAKWNSSRARVKALEIVKVEEADRRAGRRLARGDRFYRTTTGVRSARKVRAEILDWETGEPTGKVHEYAARSLEPYQKVKDRLDAEAARTRQAEANVELTMKSLDRLGVPARVNSSYLGTVVTLSQEGVEQLARAALIAD